MPVNDRAKIKREFYNKPRIDTTGARSLDPWRVFRFNVGASEPFRTWELLLAQGAWIPSSVNDEKLFFLTLHSRLLVCLRINIKFQ